MDLWRQNGRLIAYVLCIKNDNVCKYASTQATPVNKSQSLGGAQGDPAYRLGKRKNAALAHEMPEQSGCPPVTTK